MSTTQWAYKMLIRRGTFINNKGIKRENALFSKPFGHLLAVFGSLKPKEITETMSWLWVELLTNIMSFS